MATRNDASINRLSPEQLRNLGLEALVQALGPVGMVRFLQQFDTGHGDYTAERHAWLDEGDVRTVAERIMKERTQQR